MNLINQDIQNCLNDIITSITTSKEQILKARSVDGQLIIIDLNFLKYCPMLEGANIFKMLFGICKNSPYGIFPLQIDSYGYITILKDLHISGKNWYLLINFLKNGVVPQFLYYKNNGERKKMVVNHLEELNEVNHKLGGIPSFDLFYANFFKDIEDKKSYNPLDPEHDYKKLYIWSCCIIHDCKSQMTFEIGHNAIYGWEVTNVQRIGTWHEGPTIMWYRKDKLWTKNSPPPPLINTFVSARAAAGQQNDIIIENIDTDPLVGLGQFEMNE